MTRAARIHATTLRTTRTRPVRCLPGRDDRGGGASAIQLLILAPAVLLFAGLLFIGARYSQARLAVTGAAGEAARAASIARTADQAHNDAINYGQASLTARNIACRSTNFAINTSAFDQPAGTTGSVTARLACTVDYSAIGLPGLPGSATLIGNASSPLDTYRARR